MTDDVLSIREMTRADVDRVTEYWLNMEDDYLTRLGIDKQKLPDRDGWIRMLSAQLTQTTEEKQSYCLIWLVNGEAVGHTNINKIIFGEEAYMHLHLWRADIRKKGCGQAFIKMALPYYFNKFGLKHLYCEPYALNPAPNRLLPKLGFKLLKTHTCIPGFICFEQEVNLWLLTRERFLQDQAAD